MKVLLLDIEGTTAPISYVHEVLFPYAKKQMKAFIEQEGIPEEEKLALQREFQKDLALGVLPSEMRISTKQLETNEDFVQYLLFLVSVDRKFGPLKSIQGRIWNQGYQSSELQSQLFSDTEPFLRKAKDLGYSCYVYSSGSVEAQKCIYQYSNFGNLLHYFQGFFDTAVGGKKEPESYSSIASRLGVPTKEIQFFTDIVEEAEAAKQVGCESFLVERPGNFPQPKHSFRVLRDLISFF